MKIIAFIEDEGVIERISRHLGLWDLKVSPPPKVKVPPYGDSTRLFRFSDFIL